VQACQRFTVEYGDGILVVGLPVFTHSTAIPANIPLLLIRVFRTALLCLPGSTELARVRELICCVLCH